MKEFLQLMKQDVLRPTSIEKLTLEKMKRALRLIMVIKEKRNGIISGIIRGRGVADGSEQRGFIDEVDATSPTVSTEALAMTCAIDAFEGRAVLTVDIPGAYLHCFMDSEEYVLIEGVLVDLYLDTDPSARDKVAVDKYGKKRLYSKMYKALYGHMRSGRLFYEHLSAILKKMGFNPNPDKLCVWNRNIDDREMTVVLFVDDLKASFHSEEGLNDFIRDLEKVYGKLEPVRGKVFDYCGIRVGKVFDYCGITMDYTTKGVCKLSAERYIGMAIEDFERENGKIKKGAKTTAQVNLFNVRDDTNALSERKREVFHSVFARFLWVGVKARPDTLVALTFLGKRVTKANDDDWVKLERLLSYLQDTKSMPLTLGVEDLQVVKWWADSSFAVHPDMKSHSGVLGSLGRGAIYARSGAQKLNTTSSTESEIVAGSETLSQALWTSSFLRHQGYDIRNALLNQDNQAAILLQTNGVMSRKKRSRHIDICFFFIKDRVDTGNIEITFCGTEDMVADFLTKPLQGSAFRRFRDAIMGLRKQ